MSDATAAAPSVPPAETGELVPVITARGFREHRPGADIRPHDFRQSGFLAPSELRRIRLRHEQLVRSLAARLAILLRLEFSLHLTRVQILGYQKFIETLAAPTHITLFKAEPLKGVGLLVIPPRLGLALVDRLLGGAGQAVEAGRDLTELEVALLDQVATLTLAEWCGIWPEVRELQPALLGHESNSRYLQTATPDTAMLVVTMTGGMGEMQEAAQIAIPYATIEPLVRLLAPGLSGNEPAPAPPAAPAWKPEFNEVTVPVVAEWHGLKLSAGAITRLKPGDFITLEPACAAEVRLRLSQVPKFAARPGTSGGKWAVQLTRTLNP